MLYSAKNLSVFKDNKHIINEISFDFPSGSYVSIIGPNGAGKTTLLKTLAGLLDFKGSLLINNVNSDELFKYSNKNNCAYVPQNISIPDGMSLIEYVLLGRNSYTNWFLSEDKKDYEIVEKALNKLKLQTKKNQMVKTLSGGEMQRATLSRALAQEANLLLLDEPTSSLDFAKTQDFFNLIKKLKQDLKLTVFLSTHDINSISKYSEYVIVLKKGKKIFSGKINEILNEVFLSELYETKLNKIITEDGYPLFY
tara:strand:+ start:1500 stop:2258 length:759 start_codon:yes stop_codon:yes gene_type:complete